MIYFIDSNISTTICQHAIIKYIHEIVGIIFILIPQNLACITKKSQFIDFNFPQKYVIFTILDFSTWFKFSYGKTFNYVCTAFGYVKLHFQWFYLKMKEGHAWINVSCHELWLIQFCVPKSKPNKWTIKQQQNGLCSYSNISLHPSRWFELCCGKQTNKTT